MRVVVAPDKFTGSLTAVEAAVAAGYDRVTTTVAGPTGNR